MSCGPAASPATAGTTRADLSRFQRVGGHPAIDFVNTLGGLPEAPDDEYLFGYADLVTFIEGGRLLADGRPAAAGRRPRTPAALAVLDRALQLRGSLDRVLRARLAGQPTSGGDLDLVRQAYVTALTHATLQPTDGPYDWPGDLTATPSTSRYGPSPPTRWTWCAQGGHTSSPGAGTVGGFLDTSKNHSRRWCSMNSCGSIMKMRRYRAARRRG
ncbi:CGNR zinc finger domain-containing protein [Blastococcus saxobsidens]|uniref:Conserved protein containing a Zn-ribbon-like motif, possibly RNA-binding n=1 Tax=Blastococcus saxobsidens (strain DD2) TaxID=1146883 RepID=H6RRK4_BLASD|nr:CGNR zinc finger domain-containing protein [Blastococcus saxobsidens]CCG01647.1 Conserved protein containing a Zn-ribbon-like motif, possibly RNA-binding [Blastococcus saxobsidens DD2]